MNYILTSFGNIRDVHPLLLRHEPEEGEDDDTREHGGARVHTADHQRVLPHTGVFSSFKESWFESRINLAKLIHIKSPRSVKNYEINIKDL